MDMMCLTPANWVEGQDAPKYPVIETSIVMVHCDRYVDAETDRGFQQIERSNL